MTHRRGHLPDGESRGVTLFRARTAPRAHSIKAARNHRWPLRVLPDLCLPALSWLPGQMPAHDAAWAAVGKRLMSSPSSARICSALRRATPVMVSRRSSAPAKGHVCSSIRAAKRAIC